MKRLPVWGGRERAKPPIGLRQGPLPVFYPSSLPVPQVLAATRRRPLAPVLPDK